MNTISEIIKFKIRFIGQKKKKIYRPEKLVLWQRQHPLWMPVHFPAVPLPIQFPDNAPWKAAKDALSAWAPEPKWKTKKKLQVSGFSLEKAKSL